MDWEQTDCNVQIGHLEADLRDAIFGPCEIIERDSADMLDVLVLAGVCPSRSQARKNWDNISRASKLPLEIPFGSSLHTIGKKNLRVFIHRAWRDQ